MNGFVSLIGSMAWPLASLSIAYLFRHEVRLALGRVGRVKYRDFEMTFHEDLHQAESLAKAIAPGPAPRVVLEVGQGEPIELAGSMIGDLGGVVVASIVPPGSRGGEGLARIAARSPREAMLGGWDEVGRALLAASARLGDRRAPSPTRAVDALDSLVARGWLAGPEARLIERLRAIRDRVARLDEASPAPTPDEARRYLDLALPAAARLDARA